MLKHNLETVLDILRKAKYDEEGIILKAGQEIEKMTEELEDLKQESKDWLKSCLPEDESKFQWQIEMIDEVLGK